MTPPNPLVAGAVDTSTPLSGTFLLEDGEALVNAIRSGDWVAGGFAAFGAVMDTVAAVSDPLGSLIAAGLGWLMEHLQPLKGWLDDLTGDAGQVAGFAQTWANVGGQLRQSASDLAVVLGDLDAADGAAVRAYLAFQRDVVKHLQGAASWADGMQVGMQMASTIVQVVHDLVRDSLAQLVGSLISYAAELVFSLGLATPLVIEQASTRVSALAAKFSKKIPDLVDAAKKLAGLLEKLKALFKKFGDVADKTLKGAAHSAKETVAGLPGVRRLDPRRTDLIDNMENWANGAGIPGYHPFGNLSPEDFIDTHLKGFDQRGFPDWRWPSDNGFDTSLPIDPAHTLYGPGDRLDRIAPVKPSQDGGEFTSPPGTAFPTQSLPPDRLAPGFQHHTLEIVKPLPDEVKVGSIAKDFQQPGGGVQLHFPGGIRKWIEDGYIKVV